MDHHGHLRCEAMKTNSGGLNSDNDHCLICNYDLAIYDQPATIHFSVTRLTTPFTKTIYNSTESYLQPGFHFLLRAPPQQPVFIFSNS
jgi:hypothetical protein